MRGKEEAHDYRYFPDPDLIRVEISDAWIDDVRRNLPELPLVKRERFVAQYGIPFYDASVLTSSQALAGFFEAVVAVCGKPKTASNWVMGDLLAHLNLERKDIAESPVTPGTLAEMIGMIEDGTISGKIAKDVFEEMWASGKSPRQIVEEKGLVQITDTAFLEEAIDEVLKANPVQLEQYRGGKDKLFGFFVGQTMKLTKGKANPALLNELLRKKLSEG